MSYNSEKNALLQKEKAWEDMMGKQYFAAVCGIKNSGKTALLEKIVRSLVLRGYRVAVIKHDGHDFSCDIPQTDSWRFVEAGACGAAVFSKRQIFIRKLCDEENGEEDPALIVNSLKKSFSDADVILVEGCKGLPVRKIEVVRSEVSKQPSSNPEGRFLIVSDLPEEHFGEMTLPFESVEEIADEILGIEECLREKEVCGEDVLPGKDERKEKDMTSDFTHFDESGRARMVNVGEKDITRRTAVATGRVLVNPQTFSMIKSGGMKKGDVLGTAQIAGIMGGKRTSDLIPMCHPVAVDGISLDLSLNEADCAVEIRAEVTCQGRTGVEMEALTAVSAAALTVYDMCKAVQRDMTITEIRLEKKTGGVHGDYERR